MAEPYAELAEFAQAGRDAAQSDEAFVAYDRAWAALITAQNHATLAARNRAIAARERTMQHRSGADRRLSQRIIEVRMGGRIQRMSVPEYHRLRADGLAAIADNHAASAAWRLEEGNQQLRAAVNIITPPPREDREEDRS